MSTRDAEIYELKVKSQKLKVKSQRLTLKVRQLPVLIKHISENYNLDKKPKEKVLQQYCLLQSFDNNTVYCSLKFCGGV